MSDILKYGNAIRLAQLASDPAGAENGTIYYNTSTGTVKQFIAGGWQEIPDQALTLVGLALNDGHILIGNGSNVSVSFDTAATGDIDADATGGLTIKAGVIVNADINASAAIELSKLEALTASRALESDGAGEIVASSVTSTELGYLSGVTSAIQTQLGDKADTDLGNLASTAVNADINPDTDNSRDLGSESLRYAEVHSELVRSGRMGDFRNSFTFSADTTNASAIIDVASTAGFRLYDDISGAGIPTDSYIVAIVANTSITISNNATATATGVTLTYKYNTMLLSEDKTGSDTSGAIGLQSGKTDSGKSGPIFMFSGQSDNGDSGNVYIGTGAAPNGNAGGVILFGSVVNLNVSGDITANSKRLQDVADPTQPQDAVTLQYAEDTFIELAEKGANNGVATLDAGGKIPSAQLPNTVMEFQGAWNASTNTPTLIDGTGNAGDVYRVSVAGTQDLGSGSQTFEVGDFVIYSGSIWQESPASDGVVSVNGQQGIVSLDSDDISEGATNLYFSDERAQDAVGTILVDSSSIDFTYNDGTPSITAVVLPAGVDHDSLNNFVANEHVDHSSVSIATAANTSGLSGGGDITATRNLVVDINGTTAETSADNADKVLIYDNSATALKSMTRANFLSGIAVNSAGDINESTFSGLVNNTADQTVTGLAFNNAVVRSFKAQVSVVIDATADLFAVYELQGIQRGADWQMSQAYTGDSITSFSFNITSAGQVRVTIGNITGFSAATLKFRALTTGV